MRISVILLAGLCSIVPWHAAHAYIDPGSGSLILSMLIGFLVTAGFYIKCLWYRIIRFFKPRKKSPDSEETDEWLKGLHVLSAAPNEAAPAGRP